MNDFTKVVFAFGRSIIKIMISALLGVGVGLLVLGIVSNNRQDGWGRPRDSEIFIGVGAGLLSGGAMLLTLFLIPWLKRAPEREFESRELDEPPIIARPAPKQARPLPPPPDESSVPPVVKPVEPPPREPGKGDFFEKL